MQESTTTITHFGPLDKKSMVKSTGKWLYLPMEAFEAYLGCRFPFPQLHFAYVPAPASTFGQVCVGANIVVASTDLLMDDTMVEQVCIVIYLVKCDLFS